MLECWVSLKSSCISIIIIFTEIYWEFVFLLVDCASFEKLVDHSPLIEDGLETVAAKNVILGVLWHGCDVKWRLFLGLWINIHFIVSQ